MIAQPNVRHVALRRVVIATDDREMRLCILEELAQSGAWALTVRAPRDLTSEDLDGDGRTLLVVDVRQMPLALFDRLTRGRTPFIAVVDDEAEISAALARGANDALRWSGATSELAARVSRQSALMRLVSQDHDDGVLDGPSGIRMYIRAHEVAVGGTRVDLTPKEFTLLRTFLERRGEVLSADEISTLGWGHETLGAKNFVEAHVSRLRAKLHSAGVEREVIATVRGVGYRMS